MSLVLSAEQKIYHLLSRTSFGPTREECERVAGMGLKAYLEAQLTPENIPDSALEEKLAGLKTIRLSTAQLFELYPPADVAKERGMTAPMAGPRAVILELQQARLLRAVYSQRQLYEVMVDFWSNHFSIFANKSADRWLVTGFDRNTIRPYALGKIRDLLRATAEIPAMLYYLDNWLSAAPKPEARLGPNNQKRGLNENYARELMELHTIGVDGGYTQNDIREVARCFTGWTVRRPRGLGEFVFDRRIHDDGEKLVLGTRIVPGGGMNDGMKVIEILSRHPATERFIATKLARRFISDQPPVSVIERASDAFRQSDGDIGAVLRALFNGPEFFASEAYKAKVKKPLEFVASALRASGAETRVTPQLVRYLGRMGEPLFLAQAPTGFPDVAQSWISPDMLLTRMNFAADLVTNRLPGARLVANPTEDAQSFARLIAPEGLSMATQSALRDVHGTQALALLMAAPEFQRK
jgi:uncharacterized protein (DUF1800 family)